jgi:hypothetical protein
MNVSFLIVGFSVFEFCVALYLWQPHKVFSPDKAEIAVETRQVFHRRLQNREEFPEAISRNLK